MTSIITVPLSLDSDGVERVLEQVALAPVNAELIVDARFTRWADAFGLTALLALAHARQVTPILFQPEDPQIAMYWERAGFFHAAENAFDVRGRPLSHRVWPESDSLVAITRLLYQRNSADRVAGFLDRTVAVLQKTLGLESRHALGFCLATSACLDDLQKITESDVWMAVHVYNARKRLGKRVVQLAICCSGHTLRQALVGSEGDADSFSSDGAAISWALSGATDPDSSLHAFSSLRRLDEYRSEWNGKLTVRSGTARLANVPAWDDEAAIRTSLAPFAGIQLMILLPEPV